MTLPLLVPLLPTADQLRPWLERIDAARRYTNFGPLNAEFEEGIAREASNGTRRAHVTTLANATLALELALQAYDLPPAARVAVPALTFVATATAVRRAGAVPLLCDVDVRTWCLEPQLALRAARECGAQALLPVATFGAALDPLAWDAVGRDTGLPVLVDAAGAFGAQCIGADMDVVYSFHATKAFGIGEGGAFASTRAERVARVRKLSNFGIELPVGSVEESGTNAKLSEYHAAVGLAAFEQWPRVRAERDALATRYREALLAASPRLQFQHTPHGAVASLLTVRLPDPASAAHVAARLGQQRIETRRWYCPPLHRHAAFADCPRMDDLPNATRLGDTLLGLPFHLLLSASEIDYIAQALARALRESP